MNVADKNGALVAGEESDQLHHRRSARRALGGRYARKGSGEDHDGSERTGFTIDCRIRPIAVAPDLRSSKRDEQAENNGQRREEPGRDRLKCTRSLTFR